MNNTIQIGTCITILDKNNDVNKEMVCINIEENRTDTILEFQSIDLFGRMHLEKITYDIFNLLNWNYSPIPKFRKIESIMDIFEIYNKYDSLEFKGCTALFKSIDKTIPLFDTIALYFSCDNKLMELICFGKMLPYESGIKTNPFEKNNKQIPYIYVNETIESNQLHFKTINNKKFYEVLYINDIQIEDISLWSGQDYAKLKNFDINFDKSMTLDGYGICGIQSVNDNFLSMFGIKETFPFLIIEHKNDQSRKYLNTGIIVNTSNFNEISYVDFLKNLMKNL